MSSMKPLFAVALMVAGVALPACAQRGGSRGGSVGHSGGFTMHSALPPRSSFPSITHTQLLRAPQPRHPPPPPPRPVPPPPPPPPPVVRSLCPLIPPHGGRKPRLRLPPIHR